MDNGTLCTNAAGKQISKWILIHTEGDFRVNSDPLNIQVFPRRAKTISSPAEA